MTNILVQYLVLVVNCNTLYCPEVSGNLFCVFGKEMVGKDGDYWCGKEMGRKFERWEEHFLYCWSGKEMGRN